LTKLFRLKIKYIYGEENHDAVCEAYAEMPIHEKAMRPGGWSAAAWSQRCSSSMCLVSAVSSERPRYLARFSYQLCERALE
jgi:hypothetical protein